MVSSAIPAPANASGPSAQLGFIYVDPHIDPNSPFPVRIEDTDLDVDQSDAEAYLFHISAGETTAARPLAMGSSTLEIRVNSAPVVLVAEFDLDFMETGENTGIFEAEFDPVMFNTTSGPLKDDDILEFVYGDVDPAETTIATTAAGMKERTHLVLNPIESVTTGTNVTFSGTLYSLETGMELPRKDIAFIGSSVMTTTAGIIFNDPNMELRDCSTLLPPGTADGSDTQDIEDDVYPECLPDDGDGTNNVLHLFPPEAPGIPGGTIILPSGIEVATLHLQNMGNAGVTVRVTKDTSPPTTFDVTSLGFCPDVANLNLASEDGIRQIEILEVVDDPLTTSPFLQCQPAADQSVGISRVETFDTDGNPSERHIIDFEDLSLGPVSSPLIMMGGSFFATIQAPSTAQISNVRAVFNGDGDYLPSESAEQSYSAIEPTVDAASGAGGAPSTGVVPDTDVGITTISCITDSDKDGLCNSWESIGSTAGIPYKNDAGATQYYKLSTISSNLHLSNPDIWVEIDYMGDDPATPEDESHWPLTEALERVRAKFLDRPVPIYLHYVVDESIDHVDALNVWLDTNGDETNDFYNIKQNHFGTAAEHGDIDLRDNKMLKAKAQAYHYALFAHSMGPCPIDSDPEASGTPSGLGEVYGNDFIVSLGCGFGPYNDPEAHGVGTEDEQAGTFMHELGHNLNLDHGGPREFMTVPSGYATFPTTSTRQQYTITDNGPAGPSGDTSRKFTVKGLSVLTPGAASGTAVITMSVNFVDSANANWNPGVTTVGTVTRSIPSGSTIVVNSITPSVSEHSAGTSYIRQVNLKVDFTAPGSMTSTSGNLGTFTVPLTITDPNAKIKSFTTTSTPPYSPRLFVDISSTDYTENCKPNYPSVMTYTQQFSNIYWNSTANPNGYVWYPTYSNWTGADLDESVLDESVGLGGNNNYIVFFNGEHAQVASTMDPQINWKAVGSGIVESDVNNFGFRGCGVDNAGNVLPASYDILKGFDDWGNLHYNFKEGLPAIDGVYPANTVSVYLREGTPDVFVISPPRDREPETGATGQVPWWQDPATVAIILGIGAAGTGTAALASKKYVEMKKKQVFKGP